MVKETRVFCSRFDRESKISPVESFEVAAIANQYLVFSQSGLQPVQRLQAVTLRQKEIGGSRKCLDASQPLEVFPKPDAFTLDQLHCGFFMSAIVEARKAGDLS